MTRSQRATRQEAGRATGLVFALAIVIAGCAGSPASPSPGTSEATGQASGESTGPTPSASVTSSPFPTTSIPAIRTQIATLGDVVLPGGAPNAVWRGITWTGSAGPTPIGDIFRWKGGWIAQVSADQPWLADPVPFYVSTDGASWRYVTSNLGPALLVAVSGDRLLALSDDRVAGEQTLWVSSDAATWHKPETSGLDGTGITSIAGGPAGFVAVERSGSIVWSSDGSVWQHPAGLTKLPLDALYDSPPGSVVFTQGRFLLFGSKEDASTRRSGAVWCSPDGRTWTESVGETGSIGGFVEVFAGRTGLIVQSGRRSTGYSWLHSADGTSWETLSDYSPLGPLDTQGDPPTGAPDGLIAADGERIFAYKWDGHAWTSFDGVIWSPLSVPHQSAFDIGKAHRNDPSGQVISVQVLPRGFLVSGVTFEEYGAAN